MKKIYQNPTTTIVNIQTVNMFATSTVGYGSTTTATNGNLSRRGDWFDDDEEY